MNDCAKHNEDSMLNQRLPYNTALNTTLLVAIVLVHWITPKTNNDLKPNKDLMSQFNEDLVVT